MGERLRNVLNWAAFLLGIYWLGLTTTSLVVDWKPPLILLFWLKDHFLWVPPMFYFLWQIIQYIVWGKARYLPWGKD